jgi:hypothetical protein
MLFLHSFTSMLIGGAGGDAERVARHLASQPAGARAVTAPHRVVEQVAS